VAKSTNTTHDQSTISVRSCSSINAIATSFGYEPSIPQAAVGKRSVRLRLRNAKTGALVATDRGRVAGMRSAPRSDVSEAAAGLRLREPVPYPAHGLYKARVPGDWLYLLTDVLDVHIRSAYLAEEVSPPEVGHDLLPAVNPPRVGS
jgi:hypothetical protein